MGIALAIGSSTVSFAERMIEIAIPQIMLAMGVSLDKVQWVRTGPAIVRTILGPMVGWLVGIFGTRRLYLATFVLYIICSGFAGSSWSLGVLIFFLTLKNAGRRPPATSFDVADVPHFPAPAAGPCNGSVSSQPYGRPADRAVGRWLVGGNLWLALGILRQHPDQSCRAVADHVGHAARTRRRETRTTGFGRLYRIGRHVAGSEYFGLGRQQRHRMGLELAVHLEPFWHRRGFACSSHIRRAQDETSRL